MKLFVGVSISDGSIELAEISSSGKANAPADLVTWAARPLEAGVMEGGRVLDVDRLAAVLQDALKNAVPEPVEARRLHLVLPDSVTYFHVFHFPGMLNDLEVQNALQFEAAEVIPFPPEDLFGDFLVLERTAQQTTVLYAVAFKETVRALEQVCEKVGCTLGGIGLEAEALDRALLGTVREGKASVVADVGQFTTTVFVRDSLGLRGTFSIPIAGEDFTKAIAIAKKVKPDVAEKHKRTVGLGGKSDTATIKALQQRLEVLSERVADVVVWYRELGTGFVVDEVVLTGGSSEMVGMEAMFSALLKERVEGVSVRRVDPLVRVADSDAATRAKKQNAGSVLAPALGMALLVAQRDRPFLQFASEGGTHAVSTSWWKQLTGSSEWKQSTWHERLGLLPESVKLTVAVLFLVAAFGGLGLAWLSRQEKLDAAQEEEQVLELEVPVTQEFVRVAIEPMGGANEVIGRRVVEDTVRLTTTVVPANSQMVPAYASGQILVTNTDVKTHTLIAGTRFQTESGVIVRIQEAVTLDAGGTVSVLAVADELGVIGNIPVGHLVIPGLSASLQKNVYGENAEVFTGGEVAVGTLTEADLEAAKAVLSDQVTSKVAEMLALQLEAGEQVVPEAYRFELQSFFTPIPVGTETSAVTVEGVGALTALVYPTSAVEIPEGKMLKVEALAEDLSWADMQLVDVDYPQP